MTKKAESVIGLVFFSSLAAFLLYYGGKGIVRMFGTLLEGRDIFYNLVFIPGYALVLAWVIWIWTLSVRAVIREFGSRYGSPLSEKKGKEINDIPF